ncbi:MAG: DNA methyltransferase [Candidatus Hodarchaeota archaeon]
MKCHKNADWFVFFHSSEEMPEIEDRTAKIAIASLPFTNQPDGKTLDKRDYLAFIQRVFCEILRVLMPAGILVSINTDLRDHSRYNRGDVGFEGLIWQKHSDICYCAERVGFRCIDSKIWAKSLKRDLYRYAYSYIQFFWKPVAKARFSLRREVIKEFGIDIWLLEKGTYRCDSRGHVFRNAINPEIVRRCLEQLTSPGDLVVSPFTGSGTIISVAHLMGRRSIGYEINRDLEPMIKESVENPGYFPAYHEVMKRLNMKPV